ncbi:dTDP-4-dehydrorhamnose reductase [Spiribacter sp. SSL99]|uniref:dTDP-4-dehydrorhamnose reductase n=1 Tax=Spiribacter sp. SSL99 TaxID=1866884 RepID=UPI00132FD624|nr:dTDP-4-dehydrorhamnose reductase [Spiribacter sp. SSL99]KAF0286439.1 dTDP-4-dehydrorhamnose reductase [Spiribacter sp. SSL99]
MKILLLGSNGQVGWALQRSLAPLGSVTAATRTGDDRFSGDLEKPREMMQTIRRLAPDVIVNAAAYTAVDQAETDASRARTVNAEAVAMLAREAFLMGAWFIHYSTDYVFNGGGVQPWHEEDVPSPLNVYGHTKLDGERAILDSGCRHLTFRTSWVYSALGNNFIRTMLRLAAERETLQVINDQHGAPTGASLIADVTAHALKQVIRQPKIGGLYHLAAAGETTWYGYAHRVIERARQADWPVRVNRDNLTPVSTDAFPTKAQRPHNSRLDCSRLEQAFGLQMPPWEQGVDHALAEILACEMRTSV